jgi:uncharacterized protein (UPF0333 family)
MFIRKKAQSTAEYAITIGVVVAVAVGVLSVALKGGIRDKNKQAIDILSLAGNDKINEELQGKNPTISMYSSEYGQTTVKKDGYVNEKVTIKGGGQKSIMKQSTEGNSYSVETINPITSSNQQQ